MPKISGNNLEKFNKSCSTLHQKSSKIEFAFFWFLYNFLEILQESAKWLYYWRYTFQLSPLESFKTSHICPSVALRPSGNPNPHTYALPPRVGSPAAMAGRPWPTSGARPPRGSPRVDWRGWSARTRIRRERTAVAAAAGCGSSGGGAMPSNERWLKLLWDLGRSLGQLESTGEEWRGEFTSDRQWRAAMAMAARAREGHDLK
jgi:hypothetical protein